jgi:hypothetical protein
MRKIFLTGLLFFIAVYLSAYEPKFSGVLDTTIAAGASDAGGAFFGMEEYANIRLTEKLRDYGTFYAAFNASAASGSLAGASALYYNPAALIIQDNFIGSLEVERLYLKTSFDNDKAPVDISAGLLKIAFGYGPVFSPADFLSAKNPAYPNARTRAVLGIDANIYPGAGDLRVKTFFSSGKHPVLINGNGINVFAGVVIDNHLKNASIEAILAYDSPEIRGTPADGYGKIRAGFSFKTDIEVGLALDALFIHEFFKTAIPSDKIIEGLSASAAIDYSFFKGKLYVIVSYLFSGAGSSTSNANGNIPGFTNTHYVYALLRWSISDYTQLSFAALANADTASCLPIITFTHELFQGLSLNAALQFPLDRNLFNNTRLPGEFGAKTLRQKIGITLLASVKI